MKKPDINQQGKRTKLAHSKKGIELGWTEIAKFLLAIIVLVVLIGIIMLARGKSGELLLSIKNMFRVG